MKSWPLRILLVIVLLAAGYYIWASYLRWPMIPVSQIQVVEIYLFNQSGTPTQQVVTDNRSKFEPLLEVLQEGVPTSDHKCGTSGSLMLKLQDGSKLELGLLAGHDNQYYEFRLYTYDWKRYEMYRVDRAALLAALADLGITQVDLGGPE